MNIVDLKRGTICFYKNHIYEVKNIAKMKYVKDANDFSAIWEDCVVYERADNPSDLSAKGPFVRRVDDFINRFEVVNIEGGTQIDLVQHGSIAPFYTINK